MHSIQYTHFHTRRTYIGGTGGHMHNIGVVLIDKVTHSVTHVEQLTNFTPDNRLVAPSSVSEGAGAGTGSIAHTHRLLTLCSQLDLWQCGLLHSLQHVPGKIITITHEQTGLTNNFILQ